MSLEYYLICRKTYDKLLYELKNIICIFDEMPVCHDIDYNIIEIKQEINTMQHNKFVFINQRINIERQRNICNDKINLLCEHVFVEDMIDITPDRSINIRYCSVCEYTEP